MLTIKPSGWSCGNKELRTIGVFSSVGHAQDARNVVDDIEILILKFGSVDALATGTVSSGKITTLAHEAWNNPMENRIFEVKWFASSSGSLFSSAKCTEVLNCFGDVVTEQAKYDSSGISSIDLNVEVNLVSYFGLSGADFCLSR